MSNLSRANIAYNLEITPHHLTLMYGENELKYMFSSDLYRRNFLNRLEDNRSKINQSLTKRFGFNIQNDILCDLKLYTTIEKRGFLIFHNGVKIECLNTIILNGKKLTAES